MMNTITADFQLWQNFIYVPAKSLQKHFKKYNYYERIYIRIFRILKSTIIMNTYILEYLEFIQQ